MSQHMLTMGKSCYKIGKSKFFKYKHDNKKTNNIGATLLSLFNRLSFPIFVFVKVIFVKIWLEEKSLRALWELQCFGIQCISRFFCVQDLELKYNSKHTIKVHWMIINHNYMYSYHWDVGNLNWRKIAISNIWRTKILKSQTKIAF